MATGTDVANVAEQVVGAKRKRLRTISLGLVTFNLTESGMCARFVRECHEAALQHAEQTWPYRGDRALAVNANLKAAGLPVKDRQRGDVICFSGGECGHIVIYLGAGLVAENTSSGKRGTPRDRLRRTTGVAPCKGGGEATRSARSPGVSHFYPPVTQLTPPSTASH